MNDFETAKIDPSKVFASPEEVLQHDEFNRNQKIEILRRWAYDARELEVAEEENMGGGELSEESKENEGDLLDRIHHALHELHAPSHCEHSSPTKQGGDTE
jgi:hypothetical protein